MQPVGAIPVPAPVQPVQQGVVVFFFGRSKILFSIATLSGFPIHFLRLPRAAITDEGGCKKGTGQSVDRCFREAGR